MVDPIRVSVSVIRWLPGRGRVRLDSDSPADDIAGHRGKRHTNIRVPDANAGATLLHAQPGY
jgi:hypothetical protein